MRKSGWNPLPHQRGVALGVDAVHVGRLDDGFDGRAVAVRGRGHAGQERSPSRTPSSSVACRLFISVSCRAPARPRAAAPRRAPMISCARESDHALSDPAGGGPSAAAAAATLLGAPARRTENVVLITTDGLRWQEVFAGADETLLTKEAGVAEPAELRREFWRDTPAARREALLPFLWTVARAAGPDLRQRAPRQRRPRHQRPQLLLSRATTSCSAGAPIRASTATTRSPTPT